MESLIAGRRCLIVEDSEFTIAILASFLEKHSISSDQAGNGRIGLDKYLEAPARCGFILVDIQMPVMDGFEMARLIRASGADNAASIPIIAMSGNSFDTHDSLRYINRIVRKPFQLAAFFSAIQEEVGL